MKRYELEQLLSAIIKLRDNADDATALKSIYAYATWKVDTAYVVNDRFRYGNKLYRVLQSHTSQSGWTPDLTPALYVEIALPGEYREIKDGMLPTEAFSLNEIGWWQTEGNLYKSLIANNVYTPVSYPMGWEKL